MKQIGSCHTRGRTTKKARVTMNGPAAFTACRQSKTVSQQKLRLLHQRHRRTNQTCKNSKRQVSLVRDYRGRSPPALAKVFQDQVSCLVCTAFSRHDGVISLSIGTSRTRHRRYVRIETSISCRPTCCGLLTGFHKLLPGTRYCI